MAAGKGRALQKFLAKVSTNFTYKVSSLALGVLLWYFVQGEEVVEINRKIQVTFVVDPAMTIKGASTRYVEATLKGSRVLQSYQTDKPLQAKVIVPKGKPGLHEFRIEKQMLDGWNPKIDVIIHDPVLSVYIDQKASRMVPVKVITQGLPGLGKTVEKIDLSPSMITISGPKSEIDRTTEVTTLPLEITDLSSSTVLDATIAPTTAGRGITTNPTNVKAEIQLGEIRINRQFTSVPLVVEGGGVATAFSPKFVTIVLQGTKKSIESISRKEIRAFVDVRDLPIGPHQRKIQVKIPQDTTLVETNPSDASVEIHRSARR